METQEQIIITEKEETEQERKTRRTTLKESLVTPFDKKSPLLPKSIDIRLLEGNIFLGQKPDLIQVKEICEMKNDPLKLVKLIRNAGNRVNFYCEIFDAKAQLLMNIMSGLYEKFKNQIDSFIERYSIIDQYILRLEELKAAGSSGEAEDERLEELRKLYGEFKKGVSLLAKKVSHEYNKLVADNRFKDTLEKIVATKKNFSFCFSSTIRFIQDKEDIYSNFDPNRNLFILENKICSYMKIFRIFFNKKVIYPLFAISEELEKQIKEFNGRVKSVLDFFKENDKIEDEDIFSFLEDRQRWGKNNHINFYEIMSVGHRKFIKKKLGIKQSVTIRNEDFLDFFEFYDFKYSINSPFIVSYLKCEMRRGKAPDIIAGYLCLDVSTRLAIGRSKLLNLIPFVGIRQLEPPYQEDGLLWTPVRLVQRGAVCPYLQGHVEAGPEREGTQLELLSRNQLY